MRMPRYSLLLLVVLLSGGCIYYDPYPGPRYGYPPPRYAHRHRPNLDDEPMTEDENNTLAPQSKEVVPPPPEDLPNPDAKVQPPPPTRPEKTGDIPTAAKGSKPGRVKNPFQPGQELDISGMPSGSLAKDPVTGKMFRIP